MALLELRRIKLGFGGPALLDGVDLSIEPGERLCLVGRNGSGKSTLMKLIAGEIEAEEGEIQKQDGLRIARLAQEVPHGVDDTAFDVIAGGLGKTGALLAEFHRLSQDAGEIHDANCSAMSL